MGLGAVAGLELCEFRHEFAPLRAMAVYYISLPLRVYVGRATTALTRHVAVTLHEDPPVARLRGDA